MGATWMLTEWGLDAMRARNIKPGYFKNSELLTCTPLARLLFAGLWCLVDREGRVKDDPVKLKIEILPMDTCDVVALLDELEQKADVIERYQIGKTKVIQVVNFTKHQRPHENEKASELPPKPKALVTKVASDSDQRTEPLATKVESTCDLGAKRRDSGFRDSEIQDSEIQSEATRLSTAWVFYRKKVGGAVTGPDQKSKPNFDDLLAAGVSFDAIESEIARLDRPKSESIWDFCKRLNPRKEKHGTGGHLGPGRIPVDQAAIDQNTRRRAEQKARSEAHAAKSPSAEPGSRTRDDRARIAEADP